MVYCLGCWVRESPAHTDGGEGAEHPLDPFAVVCAALCVELAADWDRRQRAPGADGGGPKAVVSLGALFWQSFPVPAQVTLVEIRSGRAGEHALKRVPRWGWKGSPKVLSELLSFRKQRTFEKVSGFFCILLFAPLPQTPPLVSPNPIWVVGCQPDSHPLQKEYDGD